MNFLIPALLGTILTVASLGADTFPDQFIFIGDDLSDAGNYPNTPFTERQTVWPMLLGDKFGMHIAPSSKGKTDFASAFALTNSDIFPNAPSILDQTRSVISTRLNRDDPIFVFGGVNDLLFQNFSPFSADQSAQNLLSSLKQLNAEGFGTLIVLNLFDVGKLPQQGGAHPPSAVLTEQSLELNRKLHLGLKKLSFDALLVDMFSLFDEIYNRPSNYGFINVASPAPSPTNPDGYLFAFPTSFLTPLTAAFHQVIADHIEGIIAGASCFSLLADQPHAGLRSQNTTILQQLFPFQGEHEICKIYPFIAGNYLPDASPLSCDICDYRAHSWNVVLGVTDRIFDPLTVGLAVGISQDTSNCKGNRCTFDTRATILSFFSSYVEPCFFVDGIFNYGWLDFPHFDRRFSTGPLGQKTHGKTKGTEYSAFLEGGYYLLQSPGVYQTGPFATLAYQRVFVDGLTESGATIGNVAYKGQSTTSFITGFGWCLRHTRQLPCVTLTTNVALAANVELGQDERRIHLGEKTLPGVYGAWPIVKHQDGWFGSGNINVTGTFVNGTSVSLGYTLNNGDFGMYESCLTASINHPFW